MLRTQGITHSTSFHEYLGSRQWLVGGLRESNPTHHGRPTTYFELVIELVVGLLYDGVRSETGDDDVAFLHELREILRDASLILADGL